MRPRVTINVAASFDTMVSVRVHIRSLLLMVPDELLDNAKEVERQLDIELKALLYTLKIDDE